MSKGTKIQWTDATWSMTKGCTRVSRGCTNCWAIPTANMRAHNPNPKIAEQFSGVVARAGERLDWTGVIKLLPHRLVDPLKWRAPLKIFACSESDLFHDGVPDAFMAQVWAVMALTPRHTYQILTKRPARMRSLLTAKDRAARPAFLRAVREAITELPQQFPSFRFSPAQRAAIDHPETVTLPLPNVWLGVSCEDQKTADRRIPKLLDTPAAVRWLSCEPLVGPLDLRTYLKRMEYQGSEHRPGVGQVDWYGNRIRWVVAGGESGPHAEPMSPDWPRNLRDQCAENQVAFFFKQWGEWAPTGRIGMGRPRPDIAYVGEPVDDLGHRHEMHRIGKTAAGESLDGRLHHAFPTTNRVDPGKVSTV